MKIVKFKNGKYGIRKLSLTWGYKYYDSSDSNWWPRSCCPHRHEYDFDELYKLSFFDKGEPI